MRDKIYDRLGEIVINTAKSNGVEAELILGNPYPITFNDLKLTEEILISEVG